MMTALAFAKRTAFFQFFFSSFTRSFIHLLRSNFANKLKKIQAECDVEEYCYDYCDFLPCNLPIVVTIKMKIQLRSWFRLTSGSFFIWRIFLSPMVTHFFFTFPWHSELRNILFFDVFHSFSSARPISSIMDIGSTRKPKSCNSSENQKVYLNFNGISCSQNSFTMMANADKHKKYRKASRIPNRTYSMSEPEI